MRVIDLDNAKLHQNKIFMDVNFKSSKCFDAVFDNCEFLQCSFSSTYLDSSEFCKCNFVECKFESIIWSDIKFISCDLNSCIFLNDYYSNNISFTGCKLDEVKFTDFCTTEYDKLIFEKCNVIGCIFYGISGRLKFSDESLFLSSSFKCSDFKLATIKGCRFIGGDFYDVDLEFSNLDNLIFKDYKWSLVDLGVNGNSNNILFSNCIAKGCTGSKARLETINVTPYYLKCSPNLYFNETKEVKREEKKPEVVKEISYAPARFISGGL